MSITDSTAKEHAKDPAVLCCRAEGGILIAASNLEDPAIFADLEDSGLLQIPKDCLTIEEVIGKKLLKTTDALTPLTPDLIEGGSSKKVEVEQAVQVPNKVENVASTKFDGVQSIKIHIEEGKGIDLEIPVSTFYAQPNANSFVAPETNQTENYTQQTEFKENKKVRSVVREHFKITEVKFGDETKIEKNTLYIRDPKQLCYEAVNLKDLTLVEDMTLEIITTDKYNEYSNTIMDIQPIATKKEGDLGHGITRVLDGVVIVVTGTDANGVQIGEFGSSEGEFDRNIMWGRPGAADKGEIFIKTNVTIKAGSTMERPGPLAAHKATDYVTQEIREALKKVDDSLISHTSEINQYRRKGNKKVLIVKEIMGQGAMHDNLIMPNEPVGTIGAKANVDLGNLPVFLAPTEVLDGGIHALTCIGPASKETSRHYWREPLVETAMADEEIDVVGVVFVGSPQANSEKYYVSKRLGMLIEAMDIDGAIVTTEGFGNNHIDFASHIEEIGKRGVKVVGCTYSAVQGALVVGNKEMVAMIDNNKSKQGIENEILSNNTLCQEDAVRALAMLKTLMGGGSIKPAERKWNANVKQNNVEIVEKTYGKKVNLVENEQILPKSKKRLEIYEKQN